jgi:hypothetical protein
MWRQYSSTVEISLWELSGAIDHLPLQYQAAQAVVTTRTGSIYGVISASVNNPKEKV